MPENLPWYRQPARAFQQHDYSQHRFFPHKEECWGATQRTTWVKGKR